MGHNKLTPKQEAFASDVANKKYKYIWEAYDANYDAKKSNQNVLYVNSCKLLANDKVALRIKEIEEKIKAREKVTLDEIIVKLSQRVNMDIRAMFDEDGRMKGIPQMTQEQAMFINSWETHETFKGSDEEPVKVEIKKVKMESIKDMLDMLIRHYGGYINNVKHTVDGLDEIRELLDSVDTDK